MKKWIVIAVLVAIAAPVLGARQTVVRTDSFGTGWTKQNSMNTELYQKTDPTETGFTGMDGEVITSGVVPSAKSLSPDKVSGVPSINFFYEENGTDTNGFGFLGPLNSSKNILYRISDESPAYGNVLTVDSVVADQTITVGGGSMVADVVTLILSESAGGSVSDDAYSSAWDGVTTVGVSKNALYDKISALETQVSDMIAAFSAAGLNSFSFDPVTTFPLYSNTATPAVSVDVTDTSTTYAVSSVLYKIDAGEYTGNTMTNTAGNTWGATLSTLSEGSHDIRFQASDDKSTPNTGESAAYSGAIVVDLTNPSVGAVTPSSLTHDGTGATLTATIASVTEANEDYRQWSLYDVTDAAVQVDWTTFTGLSISGITIPADQHTYRIDVRVYDLAGNVGTATGADITYSAGAAIPAFQWNLDDNSAYSTVVATYGNNATYYVATTATNTATAHNGTTHCEGTGSFKLPDGGGIQFAPGTMFNDGVFTIQFTVNGDGLGSQSTYPRFFDESSGTSRLVIMRNSSDTSMGLYVSGSNIGPITVADMADGQCQTFRFVFNYNGAGDDVKVYQKTGDGAFVERGGIASFTLPTLGNTARFFSSASGINSWGSNTNNYYADQVIIWDSAEYP